MSYPDELAKRDYEDDLLGKGKGDPDVWGGPGPHVSVNVEPEVHWTEKEKWRSPMPKDMTPVESWDFGDNAPGDPKEQDREDRDARND